MLSRRGSKFSSALEHALHFAGDHDLLDLGRAFVDAEQPHIAIEPLDAVFAHITRAAEYLHGAIGDPPAHFGGEHLGARRFARDLLTRIAPARRIDDHATRRVDFRL